MRENHAVEAYCWPNKARLRRNQIRWRRHGEHSSGGKRNWDGIPELRSVSSFHVEGEVALGRCITRDPTVFLLDEPFSNLDQQLKEKYRVNLKTLLSHFGITTIYVTHDQQEAFILADLIAIMDVGTVEQVGTYEEIYTSPKTIFVAGFLNLDTDTPAINLIDGRYISEALEDTIVGVRPEDVVISEEMHGLSVKGCIRQVLNIPIKGATIFTAEVGDQEVYARILATENFSAGTDVWLGFNRYHVFDKATRLRVHSHPQD